MSSAVKGLPSDHFMPSLSLKVYSLPCPAISMLLATLGMGSVHSGSQRTSGSYETVRHSQTTSAVPRMAEFQVPPYWPISSTGSTTMGLSGRRSSTAGKSPASTCCASSGASLPFSADPPAPTPWPPWSSFPPDSAFVERKSHPTVDATHRITTTPRIYLTCLTPTPFPGQSLALCARRAMLSRSPPYATCSRSLSYSLLLTQSNRWTGDSCTP